MDLFKRLREEKNNWLQEWLLKKSLDDRQKLIVKGKDLFKVLPEKEKEKALKMIMLDLMGKIEEEITVFLKNTSDLWVLCSEEEVRKIWKEIEKDIVESPIFKFDVMESRTFLKWTFPKMIDIICITLNSKLKRLWKS